MSLQNPFEVYVRDQKIGESISVREAYNVLFETMDRTPASPGDPPIEGKILFVFDPNRKETVCEMKCFYPSSLEEVK